MTDTEKIIKAIEMCLSNTLISENCSECPYKEKGNRCMDEMLTDCLNLIKSIADNAIEDFAERIKELINDCDFWEGSAESAKKEIDNLVKKMIGE